MATLTFWGIAAQADVLNMASGLTSLKMVTVGNPGNAGESSGSSTRGYGPDVICGAVNRAYQIGKYEVTAAQYTEFLNAVAKTDPYYLYDGRMAYTTADYKGCHIQRTGSDGSYRYSVASDWANRPVNGVTFWNAARFVNWLNNGQGDGNTETGAYTLNGYNANDGRTIVRNSGAKWFLPSEDEWYKAAYHKNDGVTGNYWKYPTCTDTDPGNTGMTLSGTIDSPYYRSEVGFHANSASAYGTFDQGGNVCEWNETIVDWMGGASARGVRGACFADPLSEHTLASNRFGISPVYDRNMNIQYMGFRVASVPEPGSLAMLIGVAVGLLVFIWHRRLLYTR